jgi:hypothetical protein
LILLLNIKVGNIMSLAQSLVVKKDFSSSNTMIIKNDVFVLYMNLN